VDVIGSHSRGLLGTPDELVVLAGGSSPAWTIDAASGLAFPADDTEEAAFIAANPSAGPVADLIYTCQESAGNLVEAGGGVSLTADGAVTYQNAVTGFTRKAVGIPDGGANTGFTSTSATLPDPATTSYLAIVVARSSGTPPVGRGFVHLSEANQLRVNTTPRIRSLLVGDDTVVPQDIDTNVHFFFASVDETANAAYAGWEDVLHNSAYVSASSSTKRLGVGGYDAPSFACNVLAIYVWLSTIPTKAQLKARLQAHGKTVAWSP
jgi:hypothetical protein